MYPRPGGFSPRGIAIGRKPKHVPNNKEEIVRIIEGRNEMSYGHKGVGETQEEKDMWDPIGEKPWPLRMAIPAILGAIGSIYKWGCTIGVSIFIIYVCVQLLLNGSIVIY